MDTVMRPNWLDKDGVLAPVIIGLIIMIVVVPSAVISIPVVGYFVALVIGKWVGEVIGEGAKNHWLGTLAGVAAFVILPIVLQMFYGWLAGDWLMFIQSWVMNATCYWAGFIIGQNDDREEIAKTKKLLGIS